MYFFFHLSISLFPFYIFESARVDSDWIRRRGAVEWRMFMNNLLPWYTYSEIHNLLVIHPFYQSQMLPIYLPVVICTREGRGVKQDSLILRVHTLFVKCLSPFLAQLYHLCNLSITRVWTQKNLRKKHNNTWRKHISKYPSAKRRLNPPPTKLKTNHTHSLTYGASHDVCFPNKGWK